MPCLFLTRDLIFASQASGAARRAGVSLETVASAESAIARAAASPVACVLVDLGTPGLSIGDFVTALGKLPAPPAVVAYAPHVHEAPLAAAKAAGCTETLTRGQFHARLEEILIRHGRDAAASAEPGEAST